jgi:hypothetical protein
MKELLTKVIFPKFHPNRIFQGPQQYQLKALRITPFFLDSFHTIEVEVSLSIVSSIFYDVICTS